MNHKTITSILTLIACHLPLNALAVNYSYDPLGRLTQITYDNGHSIGYQYDTVGNLLTITTQGETDTDGDGIPDFQDLDDDNDGVNDSLDAFPLNPNETLDTDSDGIGNNADTDDDNDGLSDTKEQQLGTNSLLTDTDRDGLADGWEIDNNLDPLDGHCPSYICGMGSWRYIIKPAL